jgi:rRNA biogenesis protein RRP5
MAPIKRKGAAGEVSSPKKQKRGQVGPDENKKRRSKHHNQASGGQEDEASTKSGRPSSSLQKDSELSVIRDEEPSFPRGGGSILTPLERKQIQIQATRDVLFEQKGSSKPSDRYDEDDSDLDMDLQDADKEVVSTKKPRKSKSKNREDRGTTKEGVRIEGLSFKVLVVV